MKGAPFPTILYISYDGLTDPLGQSQILPYIENLSLEGYKYVVISFEKLGTYQKYKNVIESQMKSSGIIWIPISYTKSPPIFSTIYDYWKLKRQVIKIHHKYQLDLIHCRSYIASMLGLWMKRKFKVKFIFDMRGFWADERVDGGLWNLKNPIYRLVYDFFKQKELDFLNEADHIVSLTYEGKKELERWNTVTRKPLPITVIPCCVDVNLFDPKAISSEKASEFRKKLGIETDEPVLTYLGSIGTWYLLEEMLHFFRGYLKVFPKGKFLFITQDEPSSIMKKAKKSGITDGRVLVVAAGRSEVPVLLSLSWYSIFFIKSAFSKKSSSPTKQGEIMALGIPVICNKGIGDTEAIVDKYKSGIIVDSLDENNYLDVVKKMSKENFLADNLRKGAIDYFDLNVGVRRYGKIYKELLS